MTQRGRPKIGLDYKTIKKLANFHCTQEEIASFLEVSVRTLQRDVEFSRIYKKELQSAKISLRRKQLEEALKGNTALLIWLGKQYLGQSEKMEVTNNELMREEIEIIPSRGKQYNRFSNADNRLTKFINN